MSPRRGMGAAVYRPIHGAELSRSDQYHGIRLFRPLDKPNGASVSAVQLGSNVDILSISRIIRPGTRREPQEDSARSARVRTVVPGQ